MIVFSDNLSSLHDLEEKLRARALEFVTQNRKLALHIAVVEQAMDLGDLLRQFPTDDDDLKVIQILGMRIFNAFGSSLKLALSGYNQNAALILRDILETVFLLDLFGGTRSSIAKWRVADPKTLRQDFSPAAVRKVLDARYGHTTRKREEIYRLFSELAGHPTMKSPWMMRPKKDGNAVIGPFVEEASLEAVLSEMGRLGVQAGQHLVAFFPGDWEVGLRSRITFMKMTREWFAAFDPDMVEP